MRLFHLIIRILIRLQTAFWYARYYARPVIKKLKVKLAVFGKQAKVTGIVKTLRFAFLLILAVGGIEWITIELIGTADYPKGEKTVEIIWEASDGTIFPTTLGHRILEVDVMQGANPKVFRKFNDALEEIQNILEEKNPFFFARNQYDFFYDKTRHFTKKHAESIFSAMRDAALECGFTFCKHQLQFSDAILTKKLDCDTSSYLLISIGQLYNLQIKPVLVPGHMFVRFYLDGTHYINLSPNWHNYSIPDRYFIKNFHVPRSKIQRGIYMHSMNYQESISEYYAYIGYLGKPGEGQTFQRHLYLFLAKAIEEDPQQPYVLDLTNTFGFNFPDRQSVSGSAAGKNNTEDKQNLR